MSAAYENFKTRLCTDYDIYKDLINSDNKGDGAKMNKNSLDISELNK